jgi:hypothetical protein
VALALSGFVAAQSRAPARGAVPAAAAMVNGLIVELRDAPTHLELARERAQARGAAAPAGAREGGRWQRLMNDLRADAALVREVPALAQAPRRAAPPEAGPPRNHSAPAPRQTMRRGAGSIAIS